MKSEFTITLVDNGLIMQCEPGDCLFVRECKEIDQRVCEELLAELIDSVNNGESSRYRVTVDVTPLDGDNFEPTKQDEL